MPLPNQTLPKTSVFLDDEENPITRTIQKNLVSGNDTDETFILRQSLLNPPIVSLDKDLENLEILNPVKLDYNNFILVYKSISIAPYDIPQVYVFPSHFELLNHAKIEENFSTEFEELS